MIKKYSLYLAWVIACSATLGSLYYSEVRHFDPCNLCWYQRIAIYPLAIILGMATYRGSTFVVPYTIPLVVIGLILATYHVIIQEVPSWQPIELCGVGPSCADKTYIGLGPITIPMLSFLGLSLILILLVIANRSCREPLERSASFIKGN